MTIALQELIDRSVRDMGNVEEVVLRKTIEIIEEAYEEGILVQISSGHRTLNEQAKLYGQGRPSYVWRGVNYGTNGNIVTNAEPGESIHNYGLAVDYFLVSNDGSQALWTINEKWRRVAEIAKDKGFIWGGDWRGFRDYPHLQYTGNLSLKEIRNGERPSGIEGTDQNDDDFLENGHQGPQVKALQEHLLQMGYSLPKYGADGGFGPETEKAVRQFQRDQDIEVDGIVGPVTCKELNGALAITNKEYPGVLLRRGAKGKHVRAIQRKLGIVVDGVFGSQTEASVKSFQQQNHLSFDGIVGPNTWEELFSN